MTLSHFIYKGEKYMGARIAYYQHIIDLYMTKSRTIAWDLRLENYRRWLNSPKTWHWPSQNGTFE